MSGAAKAETLGAAFPKSVLHPKVVRRLENTRGSVAVACSGGADSVAALLLVFYHFPQIRDRLAVLHFNHRLRGADSDADEAFVGALAEDLGLEFVHSDWRDRNGEKPVSEGDAREARQFFFDAFASAHGGALIVTGHQQDDILETLLLRVARSSDVGGLAAPRPISEFPNGKTIVRPLLNLQKRDLMETMAELRIDWREDASNRESQFDRNRLRNEVIPAWQEATQFDLSDAAARVRQYLEEADAVTDAFLDLAKFPSARENPAEFPPVDAPRAVLRRWLHRWLEGQGLAGTLQRSMIEEMLDLARLGGRQRWSAGTGFIAIESGCISHEMPGDPGISGWQERDLAPGRSVSLPGGKTLSCRWLAADCGILEGLKKGKYSERTTVLIDSDCIPNRSFLVKPWNPGDRYHPFNAPGSRKLQDMFVDRKIPKEERIHLPVVHTADSVILWCPGLPVHHNYRVTEKTKEILQLTYTCGH